MAGPQHDLNAALIRRIKGASPEAKIAFKSTNTNAPLMLGLLAFGEQQKEEKFRTQDAVLRLYNIKRNHADYTLYENRFFKLRKKFLDNFNNTPAVTNDLFTGQEIELHEIKKLIVAGNYPEAYNLLVKLEEKLWQQNIFEMLPEVIEMAIHNNQVMIKLQQNEPLYKRYNLAVKLFAELGEAKELARRIFDVNCTVGIKQTAPYFVKLRRLYIKNKSYPRFKLIYNYTAAASKVAGAGLDFVPDFKVTNRFIAEVDRIHRNHPLMPDKSFVAGYSATQDYMVENLRVTNCINNNQYKEAAELMKQLYDRVMAPDSNMKRMRGDAIYRQTCFCLATADRYAEMLEVAKAYLKKLVDEREEGKLHQAYIEIITAHIGLYTTPSGYTDAYIDQKLGEYVAILKASPHAHYYNGFANCKKVQLLLQRGQYTEAQKLFNATDFSSYFSHPHVGPLTRDAIALLLEKPPVDMKLKKLQQHAAQIKTARLKNPYPIDCINLLVIEKMLIRVAGKG